MMDGHLLERSSSRQSTRNKAGSLALCTRKVNRCLAIYLSGR